MTSGLQEKLIHCYGTIGGRRYSVLALLTITLVSLAGMAQILFHPGWPHNHDALNWKFITQVYAGHFQRASFFPIWSMEDANGLGSPLPLFYHKLFFYCSGAIYALTGGMKGSIVLSLWFWSAVGGWGMYRLAKYLGCSEFLACALSASLILQDYCVTDWLIRGAFSEFTACNLIPYLVLAILIWVQEQRLVAWSGLLFILLFLAHSVIGFYGVLLALSTLFVRQIPFGKTFFPRFGKIALGNLILGLACLTPYLFAWQVLRENYLLSTLTSGKNHPNQNFRLFPREYLWDSYWHWGNTWSGVSTELNLGTLLFAGLIIILVVYSGRIQPIKIYRVGIWLSVALSATFLFQTRLSSIFYRDIPGLAYLQFPYRLLAFIQALILALIAFGCERVQRIYPPKVTRGLAALLFVLALLTHKAFRPIKYEWFTKEEVERPLSPGKEVGIASEAGYSPKVKGGKPREFASQDCHVTMPTRHELEPKELIFSVDCRTASAIVLPINYSGLERVQWLGKESFEKAYRTEEDPRVRIEANPMSGKVVVVLPRLKME